MKRFLYLTLLFLIMFSETKGQETIKYDITVAGFTIGEMIASKNNIGPETKYEINSSVSFWFFGKVSVDFNMLTRYKENLMTISTATTKTNKGDFHADIKWLNDKNQYKIAATSYKYKLDTVINRSFDFSSAKLYFEEPVNHREFMAENFGLPSSIKKIKDYYEVNVNGNRNRFFYVNGKLDKAIMESPVKNYVIRRKTP